ncbi:TRAP transporter small permease subunit [Nisaea sediminum]|uniref:TRAP transporter small permease subunit n=1 Tax=Nisaea sediminum TaxID=2775867 RepID=UPI0018683C9C|nr:TRAP transporter small permease subunit [Nisaea sediminum]
MVAGRMRALRKIVELGGAISAMVFLPALIAVSIFDITGRRFLQYSSTFLQELAWHFFFGCVMLCIGYAYLMDRHVRVDILRERLPARLKTRLERVLLVALALPSCLVLFWFGTDMAWVSFTQDEGSRAALGLSARWIVKSALPLGMLLLLLAVLYRLFHPASDRADAD